MLPERFAVQRMIESINEHFPEFRWLLQEFDELKKRTIFRPSCPIICSISDIIEKWLLECVEATVLINKARFSGIDPVVSANKWMLMEALLGRGGRYCICGGGACASNPAAECHASGVDILNRSVCNTGIYFYSPRRCLGVSDGTPFYTNYNDTLLAAVPKISYEPTEDVVEVSATITPEIDYNYASILLSVYFVSSDSGTCCDSCPSGSVNPTSKGTSMPVIYYEISGTVNAGVQYLVKLQFSVS